MCPGHRDVAMVPSQMGATMVDGLVAGIADHSGPTSDLPPPPLPPPHQEREDSIDSSTMLVGPDTPVDENGPADGGSGVASCLSTVV